MSARTRQDPAVGTITVAWLVKLRWGAAALQALTVAVSVVALRLPLQVAPLAGLIGITVATNLWLELAQRGPRPPTAAVPAVFVTDTLLITGLLYFAGGPSNPFSAVYLVHITLAALVLGMRWAWALVALSSACYLGLFFKHVHVHELAHDHGAPGQFGLHLQGMWLAFTLAAAMIAYFVSRVAEALREREAELANARELAARMDRIVSLTTLAAGAAHELGTPLGTIAIAAGELERRLEAMPDAGPMRDDARLIRDQLARCRAILDQMSARVGDGVGEAPTSVSVNRLVHDVREHFGDASARIETSTGDDALIAAPATALSQALGNLVKNALEASEHQVVVSARSTADVVHIEVRDRGRGMEVEVLRHVGEPFFTTKETGKGMGLGVFLAQTLAVQLHGSLRVESEPGKGTTAILELPRAGAS